MSDREEFEKACPVPEGVYWESWGNGDGQYEAVSPGHEEFADVQQARMQGWQAARAHGVTVPMTRIAGKKLEQLGGDVCGVLVRKDEKLAAVDEHGRVQWLQSGQGAEPVGVISHTSDPRGDKPEAFVKWLFGGDEINLPNGTELYTHPPKAQAVLEGWKLVPVEPTPEMREAFFKAQEECEDFEGVYGPVMPDHQYSAMLSVAPQPPQEGEGDE